MTEASSSAMMTVVKRKGRAKKLCAEAYCLVLYLSLKDIVVNRGKMSTKQQEELIKVKATQCVPELRTTYARYLKVDDPTFSHYIQKMASLLRSD